MYPVIHRFDARRQRVLNRDRDWSVCSNVLIAHVPETRGRGIETKTAGLPIFVKQNIIAVFSLTPYA